MKIKLLLFWFIFLLIPGISGGAVMRSLNIDFTFSAAEHSDRQLLGYKLYKDGKEVCKTDNPDASSITCEFPTEEGTFDFTLSAYYSNETESRPSPSFPFIIDSLPDTASDTDPDDPSSTDSTGAELRSMNIDLTFTALEDPDRQLRGYRLYKEGEQVCETDDPNASRITCEFITEEGTFNFTLTAYYSDGTASRPSPSFLFTIGSGPTAESLQAIIKPTLTSGEVPLQVMFDGTASTGTISTSTWEFGDGTSSSDPAASHTYSIPGIYTVTLDIKGQDGANHQATTTITARKNTSTIKPPTAVLSSSTAAGDAPLTVNFNGTASTTPNPPIVRYDWTFGDSSHGTGAATSHTYITAGTYRTELTVEDSKGLKSKIDTPIIVVGSVAPNMKPIAVIATDLAEGSAPFTVSFNGSQSSDNDGSITRYNWNFGDGTTGVGRIVKHTYTGTAVYTVSLQITDDRGDKTTATKEITCNTAIPTPNFEVGKVTIDHEWVKVLFENNFTQPVIIAGPPMVNEAELDINAGQSTTSQADPVQIRVRNIDREGFEIRLQEWNYQDSGYTPETFSYIVMEKGKFTLDNGVKLEAGSFTGSSEFQMINLHQSYNSTPIILTQVITENETGAVTGRIQNSSKNSFEHKLLTYASRSTAAVRSQNISKIAAQTKVAKKHQKDSITQLAKLEEMGKIKATKKMETIGYIAWEPGEGKLSGVLYETGLTPDSVTHNWFDLIFRNEFQELPLVIAKMQTYADRDNITVRSQNLTNFTTQIKTEKEQSKDPAAQLTKEVIGYLIIGDATTEKE